jgi:3-(3-hydroxy-phenyl)propionate hydroxylase
MQRTYINPVYTYVSHPDLNAKEAVHHPVVIVGAGPGGLALAIDFALHGISTVVLDDNNTVSVGSRAICFAKRTLEIMNRLGCAKRMIDKGVIWKHGKIFFKEELVYHFDLLEEANHQIPAFINLQQYYFEEYLVDKAAEYKEVDLRWKNKVISIDSYKDSTKIQVSVPNGEYTLTCDYLICADGCNSGIRSMLGLESKGQIFQDRFLIVDVVMKADFPTERWFWFDPPFHPEQSVLLHKQPDDLWRIDLQLGWDADPEHEKQEHVIRPRIQAMLGPEAEFDIEWSSVYTFRCRKMDHFIHNKVVFVGDAAHQVSPFGARGANGCIQSAENLVWKVASVLKGQAPVALIETYNTERQQGAKENILNSTRATDFITPKNHISRVFRDQALRLAKQFEFARTLVNSGRLSTPCQYTGSPLNSSEQGNFESLLCPGSVPKDAPISVSGEEQWFLSHLGNQFVVLIALYSIGPEEVTEIINLSGVVNLKILVTGQITLPATIIGKVTKIDCTKGALFERYDLKHNTTYLFRPDQMISGRWRQCWSQTVEKAMRKALGFELDAELSDRKSKTFKA